MIYVSFYYFVMHIVSIHSADNYQSDKFFRSNTCYRHVLPSGYVLTGNKTPGTEFIRVTSVTCADVCLKLDDCTEIMLCKNSQARSCFVFKYFQDSLKSTCGNVNDIWACKYYHRTDVEGESFTATNSQNTVDSTSGLSNSDNPLATLDTNSLTTPDVQNTGDDSAFNISNVHTSALSTSGVQTSALSTPDVQTSALSTPNVQNSGLSSSDVHTSALTTPDAETSALSTPDVQTSALSTPDVQTSALSTPDVQTSASTTSDAQTSAFTTQDVQTSASTTPDIETSASTTQDVHTSALTIQDVQTSASTISDVQITSDDSDLTTKAISETNAKVFFPFFTTTTPSSWMQQQQNNNNGEFNNFG